jgi:hypothetical protein
METLIITTSTLANEAMLSSDATLSSNIDTDPYAEYKMAFIAHLLTYKLALFYLILFVNLRWFARGVFKGHMGCIFILYTLVNTIFTLSRPDMLVTMMILLREIVLMIEEGQEH